MKRTLLLLPTLTIVAAAQDSSPAQTKIQLRTFGETGAVMVKGAVMGATVKGSPYSAVESVENTQTLADGTNIHRTVETRVFRDSEGRMRRETSDSITIWDPVANVSYVLDPKALTARQMPLGLAAAGPIVVNPQRGADGQVMRFEYHPAGAISAAAPPMPPLPPPPPPGSDSAAAGNVLFLSTSLAGGTPGALFTRQVRMAANTESLGQQIMEGVPADGTRTTSTIEAGEIGNDRPIQIVTERWYSRDLETAVKMTHSDPRSGQETLQLTNISRVEPTPDLFQVPPGYQMAGK